MATHLDLEEQEQLDALKAFWKQYGNLITGILVAALTAYAGWNAWQWWQRDQAYKSGAMFEQLERAALIGDADQVKRVFDDMKSRYPRTVYTQQGALLAAKTQAAKGQMDAARESLAWLGENAGEDEYRTIARLRLAGLLLDQKKYDEALKQLDASAPKEFEALVADRRGDILLAQGKPEDAKAAYGKAWQAMADSVDYRRLIEAKLTSLGAPPAAVAATGAAR
ncbi:MAG: tetratricopeptide repeat protein [Burkholderiaceae bacterium]